MFLSRKYLVLLLAAAFGSSCIREDMSGCPEPGPGGEQSANTLKVKFVHPDIDIDLAGRSFDNASLYVFDRAGTLLDTISLRRPIILDQVIDTKYGLDPKEYHFVAWISNGGPYALSDSDRRSEAEMRLQVPITGELAEPLPWLLYGEAEYLTTDEYNDEIVNIPLVLDNYVVTITATGLENATRADSHAIRVKDQVPTYNFDNKPANGKDFYYNVPTTYTDSTLKGTVITVGLDDGSDPELSITDSSDKTIYPTSDSDLTGLVELIRKAHQENFEKTHRYDVEIIFSTDRQTGIRSVQVLVNGWEVKQDEYGL